MSQYKTNMDLVASLHPNYSKMKPNEILRVGLSGNMTLILYCNYETSSIFNKKFYKELLCQQ